MLEEQSSISFETRNVPAKKSDFPSHRRYRHQCLTENGFMLIYIVVRKGAS